MEEINLFKERVLVEWNKINTYEHIWLSLEECDPNPSDAFQQGYGKALEDFFNFFKAIQ